MLNVWLVVGSDGSSQTLLRPEPIRQVSSSRCPVYEFQQVSVAREENAASFSDFDKLIDSLEKDPEASQGLKEGRSWVASTYYRDIETLASLRLKAGLSQKQLAQACGIEQPHISRYESGKHEPSISVAAMLSNALGVNLDQFFDAWNNSKNKLGGKVEHV